jgi:hypothetical protein
VNAVPACLPDYSLPVADATAGILGVPLGMLLPMVCFVTPAILLQKGLWLAAHTLVLIRPLRGQKHDAKDMIGNLKRATTRYPLDQCGYPYP